MLNHETDVIGNSQNAKKKKIKQCHCPEFFSFMWHSESFFFGAKNCLGDTCRNSNLIPKKCATQLKFLFTLRTSWMFHFLKEEGVKMQIVFLLLHQPVE